MHTACMNAATWCVRTCRRFYRRWTSALGLTDPQWNYWRKCFLILRSSDQRRMESTATRHDDNPGGDGEEQDIFQVNATRWHGQGSPYGRGFVDYHEDDDADRWAPGGAAVSRIITRRGLGASAQQAP